MSSPHFPTPSADTLAPPAWVDATPRHSAEQLIGQIIDDKYRVDRVIGMGGMGVVVAATQMQLDRLVAIKLVRQNVNNDSAAVERLLLEARAAARIRSEHVADVLDFGILPGGAPFIVMEYLEGDDLAKLLEENGPFAVPEAVDLMLQACEALAEAHLCGIVHRDLKPGNLFVARLMGGSPCLKVVDFGISKQVKVGTLQVALTTSPRILGTPNYMAPEQMRGHASGPRADIWALGAILFELLTGRQAFEAGTLPRLCQKVLTGRPPPLRRFRPNASEKLESIIECCLSKNLDERFSNVAQLARKLAPFGRQRARLSLEHILAMTEADKRQQTQNQDNDNDNDNPEPQVANAPQQGTEKPSPAGALKAASKHQESCSPSGNGEDYAKGNPSSVPATSTGPGSSGSVLGRSVLGRSVPSSPISSDSGTSGPVPSKPQASSNMTGAPHSISVHPANSSLRGWIASFAALVLVSGSMAISYFRENAPGVSDAPRRGSVSPSAAHSSSSDSFSGQTVTNRRGLRPASETSVDAPSTASGKPNRVPMRRPILDPLSSETSNPRPRVVEAVPRIVKAAPNSPVGPAAKPLQELSGPNESAENEAQPTDPWNHKNFGSRL